MSEGFQKYPSVKYTEAKELIKEKKTPAELTTCVKTKKSHNLVENTLLRSRYELKYHIPESKAQEIRQFVKSYLPLDRYCRIRPSGVYPVVSLYLDSKDLQLCRDSLEGKKNRFKLRIRSYTDDPEYPLFFEVKRRLNNIIIKSHTQIMHYDVTPFLSKSILPLQNYGTDEEILKQILLYMNSINAKPVARIRYIREAYESDTSHRMRITFDRQICYNVATSPNIFLNGGGSWQYNSISLNGVILEIKFTERYPAWLNKMVRYFDLQQQSISKYATSIQQACLLGFCAPQLYMLGVCRDIEQYRCDNYG